MEPTRSGWAWCIATGTFLSVTSGVALVVMHTARPAQMAPASAPVPGPVATDGYAATRLTHPDRTEIRDGAGRLLAVFTDGARTVRLTGPRRTFAEPTFTKATVATDSWIRLAPAAWTEGTEQHGWFRPWLDEALADRSPDALATAMEYIDGAQRVKNSNGLQYAGDASFGPLSDSDPDGRAENSDFYDYLGVSWSFPNGKKEKPNPDHLRALDCSGFIRMVYGYRLGYPLLGTNTAGAGLPRRAYAMAEFGPGVLLIHNTGKQAREYGVLQPGDLVFFSAGPRPGANIEHSGIYLGLDDSGHHRFISSRATADGPTLGDLGGEALLDGPGYWAYRFRTARRI